MFFNKKIKPCDSIGVDLLDNGLRVIKLRLKGKVIQEVIINKETSVEAEKVFNKINNYKKDRAKLPPIEGGHLID